MALFSSNLAVQRRPGRRRGFTLVEVLATLMLLAIALPVIMRGIALSSAAASASKRRNEAASLAESKLNELIATGMWQNSALQGDFSLEGWPDYTWSAQLQQWGQANGAQGTNIVQEMDLQVLWNGPVGQPQSVTVSTLVYQTPAPAPGAAGGTDGQSTTGGTQ
ncbi:MAG TPA: type II secretion system protein [Tepidisphaeraceae bacterium]|nr:type II secretion system protein [Tepidisphaeraceae bacterium]